MKTSKKGAIPPLRYHLKKVLRDMGGISHWAAKGKKQHLDQELKKTHKHKSELFAMGPGQFS